MDELLLKNNSFRIGHRNIQKVAIAIFKVKLVSAPETMKNVFSIIENTHDLRNGTKLKLRNIQTVRCGLLLLHQEFGALFQEVIKNVVLLTNLRQKSIF